MGQQSSSPVPRQYPVPSKTTNHRLTTSPINHPRLQHQGILKLRQIPFRNSIQISQNPPLFLQCSDTTLAQLLATRYNSTKLFTQDDILKLIESIMYTLSYLQSQKAVYPDLCAQHIYYDTQSGSFKLLPVELIRDSAYTMAQMNKKFTYLAPQLVLAMRYGETTIENEIMTKANVFGFGMLLLEVCTLRSSRECYDDENYDILDEVLTNRLEQVREFYPEILVKYIAQMLEYDYVDRMDPRQLSVELNRDLRESRLVVGGGGAAQPRQKMGPQQMVMQQQMTPQMQQQMPPQMQQHPQQNIHNVSIGNSNVQYKPQLNLSRSQLRYAPKQDHMNNSPYMPQPPALKPVQSAQYPSYNMSPSPVKIQRNYSQQQQQQPVHYFQPAPQMSSPYQASSPYQGSGIYGHQFSQQTQTPRYPGDYQQSSSQILQPLPPQSSSTSYKPTLNSNPYQYPKPSTASYQPPQSQAPYNRSNINYQQQQVYRSPIDQTRDKRQQTPTKTQQPRTTNVIANIEQENKRFVSSQQRGYNGAGVFKEVNQTMTTMNVDKSPARRRTEYVSPIVDDEITDNSISRLKEEIEKSRKLIMEFQRLEGIDGIEPHKNKKYQPA